MFYSIVVEYFYNDSSFHEVSIVWSEEERGVLAKAMNMYRHVIVYSVKIAPIDLDRVKNVATAGGMTLAKWEIFS